MVNYKILNFFIKEINIFRTGLFFLPSAPVIAFLLIIISLSINSFKKKDEIFKDKANLPIFITTLLMLISSILQVFFLNNFYSEELNQNASWFGLFNWIPFFWVFCSSQEFLKAKEDRKLTSLILCLSTIPVIFSGIGQTFFNWHGPLEFLNGIIIWYQRPIDSISGLTAQFNHANYAGAWFTFILPLCIAQSFNKTPNKIKNNFSRIILSGIITCIFLTNSRNAWGCTILTIPIVIGIKSFRWFLPTLLGISSMIAITTMKFFKGEVQDSLRNIIPNKVWLEFTNEGFNTLDATRIEILNSAKEIIIANPLVGTGSGSFPIIYEFQTGFWKGHSHNLFTEFAISNGIPSTILFLFFLIYIMYISFAKIFKGSINNISNKALWTASFIFLLSQMIDIQYFDGRISLIFWLFLASLKCIAEEKNIELK